MPRKPPLRRVAAPVKAIGEVDVGIPLLTVPVADDPVADDPVADDPVADDPVADDPAALPLLPCGKGAALGAELAVWYEYIGLGMMVSIIFMVLGDLEAALTVELAGALPADPC